MFLTLLFLKHICTHFYENIFFLYNFFLPIAVPIFLYNEAHPTKKALPTIRHELGYYKPNTNKTMPDMRLHKPDEGPFEVSRARGIATIGALPWVDLYNIPI